MQLSIEQFMISNKHTCHSLNIQSSTN